MRNQLGEAWVFGRGARWCAGAVIAVGVLLVGSSAPRGAVIGRPLPVGAATEVVPNRVMTWNMCNPCKQANVDRATEIATYAPQVIGLQEACASDVSRIRDYLEGLYGLKYHVEYGTVLQKWGRCGGVPWNPGGYGQAILSAAPMTDPVLVEYPDGGSEDRGYMAVTTTVDGRKVRVFNTHLAQRRQESVRAEQAEVLAKAVARYDRVIVVGDFNATPETAELAPLWALAEDTDPQCRPTASGACDTTTDWHSKFDYVFLRGVASLRHQVHLTPYSDHDLLQSDLDLS
ncbi:endonuclease/exonuclease/phosphatase family protein [Streptomyces sp. NPDC051913]|uniref:endonuclease/exonuclease/phosphatase family protein n=1 Tax=Streptomyces sp. NPDC051913 TaxID=3365676 RepID=UPI0037CF6A3F